MRMWASILAGLGLLAGFAAADDLSLAAEVERYLEISGPAAADPSAMTASWRNRLRLETADGDFRVELIGWLMWDLSWVSSSDFDSALTEDRAFFRSVRMGVQGHVYRNVLYKLQLELAGGEVGMRDVFVGLRRLGPNGMSLIAGHFKEPFGLEFLTPLSAIFFLERSEPTRAFVPDRNTGIMLSSSEAFNLGPRPPGRGWFAERMSWAIGLFKTADNQGAAVADDQLSLTLRVTGLPVLAPESNTVLHLGFAYTYRGDEAVRYAGSPGLVDTGVLSLDDSSRFGFELVFLWRGFSLSAEFFFTDDRHADASRTRFHGGYVTLGTWITGEHQAFNVDRFVTTAPRRHFRPGPGGVWVGYRYDRLDLDDGAIRGGAEQTHAFNVTWNWSWNARLMLDYVFVDVGSGPRGPGELHIVRMRVQFNY